MDDFVLADFTNEATELCKLLKAEVATSVEYLKQLTGEVHEFEAPEEPTTTSDIVGNIRAYVTIKQAIFNKVAAEVTKLKKDYDSAKSLNSQIGQLK